MSRKDVHLDAMLRHLGAAYYDSLHGRAGQEDVSRALNEVASQIGETAVTGTAAPRPRARGEQHRPPTHHGRWHSRVVDIMSTAVVTVDRITTYKEIAALLVEHEISGVPVLTLGRHVAGVVTEADLIAAKDKQAASRRTWTGMLQHGSDRSRHRRLTAERLMSAPAVTIHPDATIASAVQTMTRHHVKLLPVVDRDATLIGIVGRRDLLGVFLVADSEIARQVRELLAEVVPADPAAITVAVRGGIVTLTGQPMAEARHGALAAAIDLAWDIDGVVDIIDHTATPQPA